MKGYSKYQTGEFPEGNHTSFEENIGPRVGINVVCERVKTIANIMVSFFELIS